MINISLTNNVNSKFIYITTEIYCLYCINILMTLNETEFIYSEYHKVLM